LHGSLRIPNRQGREETGSGIKGSKILFLYVKKGEVVVSIASEDVAISLHSPTLSNEKGEYYYQKNNEL
jgi:hypothetical protein